ncbi:MAG TPA: DNA-binding protein [Fluviicoccus sp.]|nr:DNA-binding protein [Fluviicoccus sp.]
MASQHRPLTPEQVKERFKNLGKTITEWATENGYSRGEVYRVLNGQAKCHYGKAHEIAVKLGLKVKPQSQESLAA